MNKYFTIAAVVAGVCLGGFFAHNTYQKDVKEAFNSCMGEMTSHPDAYLRTLDEISGFCSQYARAYIFKRDFEVDGMVFTWNKHSMKYVFKYQL